MVMTLAMGTDTQLIQLLFPRRSVFGVNGPEILLSQQMTMSSPSFNPNS